MDGRNSSVRRTSGRGSSLYSTPGGYGVPPANTPEFTKTLRLSHTSPHYSAKLVSHPLSKSFPKLLVCTELTPNIHATGAPSASSLLETLAPVYVIHRNSHRGQPFCYFTHGWALFRDENFFKVGYTLVSPVHFQVIQT
ncbi:hypothetical protein KC19_VG239600 [Ceratodon purpureus]|uniref:Uncharacterized protein n=1 Tax=Ceratodon purpureus TaxID=3225 RepID=A0A8T0HUF5_CERPU|nr:hypothetical protein KC19_VG239600 [Ceratodon purpureus]